MRVTLRPLVQADVQQIYRGLQEAGTSKWLHSLPWPYRMSDAADFVLRLAQGCDQAITVDGEFAGVIRCIGEPGYWVLPQFRNKGVATRAMVIVLQDRFAEGAVKIEAGHLVGNAASRAVLLRLGFVDCGTDQVHHNATGKEVKRHVMVVTPQAFAESHALRDAPELRVVTRRIVMDRLMPDDVPAIHAILTEPSCARMLMRFRRDHSVEDIATMLADDIRPDTRPLRLAVRLAGRCVGTVGVDKGNEPAVFYCIAPDCHGKGIASEILPPFCDAVKRRFELASLKAEVFCDNPASRRVLEKAGFEVAGTKLMISAARNAPAEGWIMRRS
ncbi:GNAT family N-acetyltransferase [Paracoccus albus]|uniref:GNAT family N-acetyltransferase n=1 Tax=Paracoccus albus TaxID=3017784 RepID=UPI0022F04BB1|nr:GNAT family N-acetyltransferase [Paracoccus albus]WBU60851.1 GNAT family N-acetyltransferase [Paracoccus albus]